MDHVAALSSLLVTLGLVLARPRVGRTRRLGPASAAGIGVVLMAGSGLLGPADLATAATLLWRPIATIAAIMVMTAAALKLQVLELMASAMRSRSHGSPARLFGLVFALSAATAAVLNNDAAILLLTPVVVLLVRRTYPDRHELVVPFAFAVFTAAGVAPLPVSNPMNMIVAEFAGIAFNEYALRMIPVAVAGWLVAFVVLRALFRRELSMGAMPAPAFTAVRWGRPQKEILLLLAAVLSTYPIVSSFGLPIWPVAVAGASLGALICWRHGAGRPLDLLRHHVAWNVLAFLLGALLIAFGLRNAGLVDQLADVYARLGPTGIGVVSAAGSALLNNHPMALVNMLAIDVSPEVARRAYLSALVGGDLGPRLLPIGSLAGLLWLATLHRLGVDLPLKRYVTVGAVVTAPSLGVSLAVLMALPA